LSVDVIQFPTTPNGSMLWPRLDPTGMAIRLSGAPTLVRGLLALERRERMLEGE
jgi:hypothetical protein